MANRPDRNLFQLLVLMFTVKNIIIRTSCLVQNLK